MIMTNGAACAHEWAHVLSAATAWSYYTHAQMQSPRAFAQTLARTWT
jgi:hypothetical protein